MMMSLAEMYFGDVEAIDEGKNHTLYFQKTFVLPDSFSTSSLNNKSKFIIVGRKGAGKTAIQFHLSDKLQNEGFLTRFFSFHNDLKPSDYNSAANTQKIDMLNIDNSRNIFLNYDFREIWTRTFLIKFAESLVEAGYTSKFTTFCLSGTSRLSAIFDGILRGSNIKVQGTMGAISAELGLDLGELSSGNIPLSKFNIVALEALKQCHAEFRAYLFVDELVFSKLDAKDDEVRVRAAMVRDILRTARELNNEFVSSDIDMHIICTIRPEIRNLINEMDSEVGKLDTKSVSLSWDIDDGDDSLLYNIFKQKVIHSDGRGNVNFEEFFVKKIVFGNRELSIADFVKQNTWARPRDIVQFLNSISDKSPNSKRVGEGEIKKGLDEYSRRSFKELIDELGVRHGKEIAQVLRSVIQKKSYSFNEFSRKVLDRLPSIDSKVIFNDLFEAGVIGNVDYNSTPTRFYWFHRDEEYLKPELNIYIHAGLWNYFNIR